MSQISQDMGEGLRLTSHYVDVQLSQREIFSRCGKNTNKFLDKELIIMGDTDRQKSLMGQSQVKLLLDLKIIISLSSAPFEQFNNMKLSVWICSYEITCLFIFVHSDL